MSFVRRRIDVTITKGTGPYGENVGETIKLTGLRVMAYIASVGFETQGTCEARIFGLPLKLINDLTTIGPIGMQVRGKNRIQIDAGDEGSVLTTIYKGTIIYAYGEFQAAPDVALNIYAQSAADAALKPVEPTSINGAADVANLMAGFASDMGFAFENNGVSGSLSNPYFPRTTLEKVKACAASAGINYSTDNGVLSIWPKGGARKSSIPVISPTTGMVGYPTFSSQYVGVRSLFMPSAIQGGQFKIENSQTAANGTWNIATVNHSLESQVPNGQWFTDLQGWGSQGNAA